MTTALVASSVILVQVTGSDAGSKGWGVCVAYGQTSKKEYTENSASNSKASWREVMSLHLGTLEKIVNRPSLDTYT